MLGHEEGAQRLVHKRLTRLGFTVERVGIDEADALADPRGGYPALPYAGRSNVAGRIAGTGGRGSMHLSGHVDVVPVDGVERWTHDPWAAEIAGRPHVGSRRRRHEVGRRGVPDRDRGVPVVCGPPRGDLCFSTVIEEECGGNGMRAVLAAGYDADETLIGEPFWPSLGNGGVGVIWARLDARGSGKHAAHADEVAAPVDALIDGGRRAPRARGGAERAPRRPAVLRRVLAPVQPQSRRDLRRRLALVRAHRRVAADPARVRPRPGAGGCAAARRRPRRRRRRRPSPSRSTGSAPTPTTTTRPRRWAPTLVGARTRSCTAPRPAPGALHGHDRRPLGAGPLLLLRPARGQPARHRRVGRPGVLPPGGPDRRAPAGPPPGLNGRIWVRAHAADKFGA